MNITTVEKVDYQLVEKIKELITLLTEPKCPITETSLNKIVDSQESELIVAKTENGEVVGAMCLIVYTILSTKKAFIEDVVVAKSVRGKGYGEAMIREAIELARSKGVKYIELSSNAKRVAANSLYKKLGFNIRETNYYRMEL